MEKDNLSTEETQLLNLIAESMVNYVIEEAGRSERLKEAPEGFHLFDRPHHCCICGDIVKNEKSWYDSEGIKCLICHNSLQRNEITIALKDKETWYSDLELDIFFNLTRKQINRWVKEKVLVPLHITINETKLHLRVFPLNLNSQFLPPKQLLKGGFAKEILDGREMYSHYPWYYFVDPMEHLKEYGISNYMRFVPLPESSKP